MVTLAALLVLPGCGRKHPELVRRPVDPPSSLLIRHVAVLDVEQGRVKADRDVLIEGDRISAIGPGGTLPLGNGAEAVDGRGATLLPGLIDSHAHTTLDSGPSWKLPHPDPEANLRAYLYAGVTTIFDPGDSTSDATERRDRVARGELLGPRVFTAGKVLTVRGGHPVAMVRAASPWWLRWYIAPRVASELSSPEDARAAVIEHADQGTDFIKIVVDTIPQTAPRIDPALVEVTVQEAKRHGLRTVAHIGSVADAIDSADAGVVAWIHTVYKESIPDEMIERLAAFEIHMIPTLVVWHSYADLIVKPRVPSRLEREMVEPEILESFNHPPDSSRLFDAFAPYLELLREQQPHWAGNVRRLREAGVTMLAGSDTQSGVFPGASLHRELGLLEQTGMSRAEVIRAATLDAARFLSGDEDPDFGSVEEGKRADLLLVRGDPTRSLDALADIREVILRGVCLERLPVDDT